MKLYDFRKFVEETKDLRGDSDVHCLNRFWELVARPDLALNVFPNDETDPVTFYFERGQVLKKTIELKQI